MNNLGQAVGWSFWDGAKFFYSADGVKSQLPLASNYYADGTYTVLNVPGIPYGINDLGQIIGSASGSFLYDHGALTTTPCGGSTLAINNQGLIAIRGYEANSSDHSGLYTCSGGTLSLIAQSLITNSAGVFALINDFGQIVATRFLDFGSLGFLPQEFVYSPQNTLGQISAPNFDPVLPGGFPLDLGQNPAVTGINNNGDMVGYCTEGRGTDGIVHVCAMDSFLYSKGKFTDLGLYNPSVRRTHPTMINDSGTIVGMAFDINGATSDAIIYEAGSWQLLSALVDPNDPALTGVGRFFNAYAVNKSGQILVSAGGYYGDLYGTFVLRLDPIPRTPTTLTLSTAVVPFRSTPQNVILTSTVTAAGVPVNSGTVAFSAFNQNYSLSLANGSASFTVTVPANTPAGAYKLAATYTPGADNFASSADSAHGITVNPLAPGLVITGIMLSRDANQNVIANFTISNSGAPAQNILVASAVLGSSATSSNPLPAIGALGANATANAVLAFPVSSGSAGQVKALAIHASYSGGTVLSTFKVTLP